MKKLFTLLTVLVLFAGIVLLAPDVEAEQIMASGNCGDTISWKLTADGTLTISGSGAMPDYKAFGAPWNSYKENITSIVIESGITRIGHYAFWKSCATSVTIPATVKEVGNQAFNTATLGKKLYIDDIVAWCNIDFLDHTSNPLYADMQGMGTLYLQGEPVTKLVIPGTVSKVSRYAFHGCISIKEVIIQEGVEEIGRGAFGFSGVEKVTLPNSVTTIGPVAFSYAKKLVAINIPDSVSHLGAGVFDNCYSLRRITIPGSVKSVPFMFNECSLEYLEVLEGVESIELSSYEEFTEELKYLKLPLSIKSIKDGYAPKHLLYAGTENQWGCVQFYRYGEHEWIKVNQPSSYQVCYGEGTVEVRESCTLVGDYCTSCNNWLAWEEKNVAEHTFGNGLRLDDSNHKFTCTDCGIEEIGTHIWNGGVVTKNATCKETGVKTYTCTCCSATKTETIARLTTHTYDNACDTSCNVCGGTRTVTHQYSSDWFRDQTDHWHICDICGNKANQSTHTPGAAATESKAQVCTACGYVIQAPLGHTHSYESDWSKNNAGHWHTCACGAQDSYAAHNYKNSCDTDCDTCGNTRAVSHNYKTVWSKDGTSHWHECSACKDKKDIAAHTPSAEATETTAQTCTTCGYVIKPALSHTHSYADSWTSDEDGHWHTCSGCEEKGGYAAHTSGAAATATEDQVCTACGYVLKEATGETEPTTQPTEPSGTEATQPESTPVAPIEPTGNDKPQNDSSFVWIIVVVAVVVLGGGAAVGVIIWKKKH